MQPDLSIIIPVYNIEKDYLSRTVDSILSQSFSNYELIIIDDGSEEKYKETIISLQALDHRIHVYTQNNSGVSAARNYGVTLANGKYVTFVDGDDILLPHFFERAVSVAEEYEADILYGYIHMTKDASWRPEKNDSELVRPIDSDWLEKYTVGYLYKDGDKMFGRGPYARLLRREVALKHPFLHGVPIGEDVLWNLEILQSVNAKYIVDQIWYLYLVREESVTCKYDPNIENKLLPFYDHLSLIYKNRPQSKLYYNRRILRDLDRYIYRNIAHDRNKTSFLKQWHSFNKICKSEPWKHIEELSFFRTADIRTKFMIIIFKMKLWYPLRRLIR